MGVLLAGCGFHLQGRVALPERIASVNVTGGDPQGDLVTSLRRNLRIAGAELVDAKALEEGQPGVTLRIERDEFIERVASVSARNVPREYEMTYLVRFSVIESAAAGETARVRIESEELSVSRDFSFDERVVLAKSRERDVLRARLAEELAGIVLQRLASLR
jgi:LPS-assembly lipoprotein